MTTQAKLELLSSYEFGVYTIPGGFAVADPIGNEDSWYLTGAELDLLLDETIDFNGLVDWDEAAA